jgi:integrase
MSPLRAAIEDYLALRRSLGFRLRETARGLRAFATFLEAEGAPHVTTALALAWATRHPHQQPAEWARRLTWVRGFARHWRATDPHTEVPAWGLLPYRAQRARPYLYTAPEIQRLLGAAHRLPSAHGLRGCTYACLIGLLAVTGLRSGEALRLAPADVDLGTGVLTIRQSKFGKSRLVPLHPSTRQALQQYAARRTAVLGAAPLATFLVSERGRPLRASTVHWTFRQLSRQTGLRGPTEAHGPRLHDLRHRFAVATLLHWYRAGADVERRLPVLATYLGHAHVADTYWYLSACPELMGLARARLDRRWEAWP